MSRRETDDATSAKSDLLQGTLDLMVLKTLETLGPLHGYGIALRLDGGFLAVQFTPTIPGSGHEARLYAFDTQWQPWAVGDDLHSLFAVSLVRTTPSPLLITGEYHPDEGIMARATRIDPVVARLERSPNGAPVIKIDSRLPTPARGTLAHQHSAEHRSSRTAPPPSG